MPIRSFARVERLSGLYRPLLLPLLLVSALVASGLSARADPPAGRSGSPAVRPSTATKSPGDIRTHDAAARRLLLGLSVLAAPEQRLVTSNRVVYDFGSTSVLERPQIAQTFVLRNDTQAPIDDLQIKLGRPASTQVFVSQFNADHQSPERVEPNRPLPTLHPGRIIKIDVVVTLTALSSGRVRAPLTLYRRNFPQTFAVLEVAGMLLPEILFAPNLIEFGNGPAGQARSVLLRIGFDPDIAPRGSAPQLFCTNPDVMIAALGAEKQPLPELPMQGERPKAIHAFRLTLSGNAPLGPIAGQVSVISIVPPSAALLNSRRLRHRPSSTRSCAALREP